MGQRHLGWRTTQIDVDLLAATAIAVEWVVVTLPQVALTAFGDAEAEVKRLVDSKTVPCDMGLPLRNPHPAGEQRFTDGTAASRPRAPSACDEGGYGSDVAVASTVTSLP